MHWTSSMANTPDSQPGTYAIIYHCPKKILLSIGGLGEIEFRQGHYIYVGSAFGPGGVRARIMRHEKRQKNQHWHVDYLRKEMSFIEAWYTHDTERLEHEWAKRMSSAQLLAYPKGFGSSDCKCYAHLFMANTKLAGPDFLRQPTTSKAVSTTIHVWRPD